MESACSSVAVIQIWTALIAMLLIKYLQFKSAFSWSLSNLVAFLRWNLFTYRDLWECIDHPFDTLPLVPGPVQEDLPLPGLGQQMPSGKGNLNFATAPEAFNSLKQKDSRWHFQSSWTAMQYHIYEDCLLTHPGSAGSKGYRLKPWETVHAKPGSME